MEQVFAYVKPLKDFSKDSMRLVKRCTKPDLKGNVGMNGLPELSLCDKNRISEDRTCYFGWICHHGVHRILCQADPYTNQQYHCVSCDNCIRLIFYHVFFFFQWFVTITPGVT